VGILKKDPDQLKKQIENLEMMSKSCFCFSMEGCKMQYTFSQLTIIIIIIMANWLLRGLFDRACGSCCLDECLSLCKRENTFSGVGTTIEISVRVTNKLW